MRTNIANIAQLCNISMILNKSVIRVLASVICLQTKCIGFLSFAV